MSCCEQIGKSWGKDNKLLCGNYVFRLSQGRNFHQLFLNSKEFERLLSHWCLLLLAFMVGKNCNCSNPHSAWGNLLAWSLGLTGSQGRTVTCLVVWLLVSHRMCRNVDLPLQLVNLFEFKCLLPFLVLTDSSGSTFALAMSGTTANTSRAMHCPPSSPQLESSLLAFFVWAFWMSWIMFEPICTLQILGKMMLLSGPSCLDRHLREERDASWRSWYESGGGGQGQQGGEASGSGGQGQGGGQDGGSSGVTASGGKGRGNSKWRDSAIFKMEKSCQLWLQLEVLPWQLYVLLC